MSSKRSEVLEVLLLDNIWRTCIKQADDTLHML